MNMRIRPNIRVTFAATFLRKDLPKLSFKDRVISNFREGNLYKSASPELKIVADYVANKDLRIKPFELSSVQVFPNICRALTQKGVAEISIDKGTSKSAIDLAFRDNFVLFNDALNHLRGTAEYGLKSEYAEFILHFLRGPENHIVEPISRPALLPETLQIPAQAVSSTPLSTQTALKREEIALIQEKLNTATQAHERIVHDFDGLSYILQQNEDRHNDLERSYRSFRGKATLLRRELLTQSAQAAYNSFNETYNKNRTEIGILERGISALNRNLLGGPVPAKKEEYNKQVNKNQAEIGKLRYQNEQLLEQMWGLWLVSKNLIHELSTEESLKLNHLRQKAKEIRNEQSDLLNAKIQIGMETIPGLQISRIQSESTIRSLETDLENAKATLKKLEESQNHIATSTSILSPEDILHRWGPEAGSRD